MDPHGYYRALGVRPDATADAIHRAFRALAKRLHPDVPGTGDAAAFLRIKEAYEVLGSAVRRGEYDRTAKAMAMEAEADWRPGQPWPGTRPMRDGPIWPTDTRVDPPDLPDLETVMGPLPETRRPRLAWFRWSALLWAVGVLAVIGAVFGGVRQFRRLTPAPSTSLDALRPRDLPDGPPAADPGPPAAGDGTPHFVQPVGGGATLWRYNRADGHFRPDGWLPAFTPVALLRLVSSEALAEVRLNDRGIGYVYPSALTPGDAAAARKARCIYDAGPAPRNGERLDDGYKASERMLPPFVVRNDNAAPAVFAMRAGQARLAVFIAPLGRVELSGVPMAPWQAAFATGDLWSRSCARFMAGMQARALPAPPRPEYVLSSDAGQEVGEDEFAADVR